MEILLWLHMCFSLLSLIHVIILRHICHKWFYKNDICDNCCTGIRVWDYVAVKIYFFSAVKIKWSYLDIMRVIPNSFIKAKSRPVQNIHKLLLQHVSSGVCLWSISESCRVSQNGWGCKVTSGGRSAQPPCSSRVTRVAQNRAQVAFEYLQGGCGVSILAQPVLRHPHSK